jgi:hypothetical protein
MPGIPAAEPAPHPLPVLAKLVVAPPLVWIGEHLVGFVDFLEALLGCFVAGVHVGVILASQLAIGALDFLGRGISADAQDLVVILEVTRSHRLTPARLG